MCADEELLQLAHELRVTCQIISRRVRFEGTREIPPHCVTALGNLIGGPLLVGELANRERVAAPSMTRTVNHLVEQGLVVKKSNPADGRQVMVEITEHGRSVMETMVADRDGWMFNLLAEMDAEKLDRLKELLPLLREVAAR